jgi:hypothetical protein
MSVIDHIIPFECKKCQRAGMGLRPTGAMAHNLSEGLHAEDRDGEQVGVCDKCGDVVLPPPQNSN